MFVQCLARRILRNRQAHGYNTPGLSLLSRFDAEMVVDAFDQNTSVAARTSGVVLPP